MKIKIDSGAAPRGIADSLTTLRKSGSADSDGSFQGHMGSYAREFCEERIAALAVKIEDQGLLLSQRADIGEMERYRALIAELIAEVVANGYAVRKERTLDPRGRIKICTTINKINEKLEDLAREILSENKDRLEIISKIDDIKGLIVDIML